MAAEIKFKSVDPQYIRLLYESGVRFKESIGLYETADKNERFFAGDQWAGVDAKDLPKPVINFLKRAVQQKVSEVNANPVGVNFEAPAFPDDAPLLRDSGKEFAETDVKIINAMFDDDCNRINLASLTLDGLFDAAVSGDFIIYNRFDSAAETGQAAKGLISAESIDNVNFYPGNPNETDVQKQPYIIITRREPLSAVFDEARANGLSPKEAEKIMRDSKTELQSGDMGKRELSGSDNAKCLTFTYFIKKGGHVFAEKTAGDTIIRPIFDTKLSRYPFAVMNWDKRKNCCFGISEIEGLIPLQRYINQMYAMAMLFTIQSACPKAVFNQGMVKAWSNAVGTAIAVNGDINSAVKYLEPPKLPDDIYNLPERLMNSTLKMLGVSNIELGDINPNNTSAIVIAREASGMPVKNIKARFYTLIGDFARNWLDMLTAFVTVPRFVRVDEKTCVFDPSMLHGRVFTVKVDVGAASEWSEINSVTTLNSLFSQGVIDAKQYAERLPDGYLPMREKLLRELSANKKDCEKEV